MVDLSRALWINEKISNITLRITNKTTSVIQNYTSAYDFEKLNLSLNTVIENIESMRNILTPDYIFKSFIDWNFLLFIATVLVISKVTGGDPILSLGVTSFLFLLGFTARFYLGYGECLRWIIIYSVILIITMLMLFVRKVAY